MKYRIWINLPSKPDAISITAFEYFEDAADWGEDYARTHHHPCEVRVLSKYGDVSACYLGDGMGVVRAGSLKSERSES